MIIIKQTIITVQAQHTTCHSALCFNINLSRTHTRVTIVSQIVDYALNYNYNYVNYYTCYNEHNVY